MGGLSLPGNNEVRCVRDNGQREWRRAAPFGHNMHALAAVQGLSGLPRLFWYTKQMQYYGMLANGDPQMTTKKGPKRPQRGEPCLSSLCPDSVVIP